MDPVEFRLKNCVRSGDTILTGMIMHPIGLAECIEKVAKAIDWDKPTKPSAPNKQRGKGIAIMWKAPAMPPNAGSSAYVKLNEDASVSVSVGGQEFGQGTFTVMAQIAAAALGVPFDTVRVATPGRHQIQPLRMADGCQPPDLEHGQCRARRRHGCAQANPGAGGCLVG